MSSDQNTQSTQTPSALGDASEDSRPRDDMLSVLGFGLAFSANIAWAVAALALLHGGPVQHRFGLAIAFAAPFMSVLGLLVSRAALRGMGRNAKMRNVARRGVMLDILALILSYPNIGYVLLAWSR